MGSIQISVLRLTMKLFVAAALLVSAVSAFSINGKEELIKKFGEKNIKFGQDVRTDFCNQCMEITVSSTGGTQEHQPQRLDILLMDLSGRTWFHSGSPPTTSTSPPTPCPTPSCTTSSGSSQRWLEDSTLES